MTLLDRFHEQYESSGNLVVFRCTECGYTSMSLGSLHAHVEGHWSTLGWFKWHTYQWLKPDENKWMDFTEVLRVDETTEIVLDDVEGL